MVYFSNNRFKNCVRRCSVKKDVFNNFAKFTGKNLCQCLFFNKTARLGLRTLLKKRLWHRYFHVNFAKIFPVAPSVDCNFNDCIFTKNRPNEAFASTGKTNFFFF